MELARLSESSIWPLQRAYFEAQGPRAWSSGAVPHYVTSNPFLGRAFSEVIAGYAADRGHARPLTVVELGAGCGRLAYQLVRALALAAPGLPVTYVMTDIAERTIEWWLAHPWLRPLFEAGVLDVAHFDVERDDQIELRVSGRTISTTAPTDELVVVANYVLDSLPQDVFVSDGEHLYECLAATPSLTVDVAVGGFDAVELSYQARPVKSPAYYQEPMLDELLDHHRRELRGAFTFPCAALRGLERLRAMTCGRLMVLSADKGGVRVDDVADVTGPGLAAHGSVSMVVNYRTIGTWALAHRGTWMHTAHRRDTLEVCAFVVGAPSTVETAAAFSRAIAQRGPDDFYTVKRALLRHLDDFTLAELLATLRMSGHDVRIFLDCALALHRAVAGADAGGREDVALAIDRVWQAYFPIGEPCEIAATLGELATVAGHPDDTRWRRARHDEHAVRLL